MRVTESQLRKIIRSVVLENDMMNMQNVPAKMNISTEEIYELVDTHLKYTAATEVLKNITQHNDDHDMIINEKGFIEFAKFCNEYNDEVFAGASDWRSKEPEMQAKATALGISVSDVITILVARTQ